MTAIVIIVDKPGDSGLSVERIPCELAESQESYRLCYMQEVRVETLMNLPNKLQDPASAAEIGSPGVLMAAWNKMLQLLADPDAPVRQAAAPVVGCIGALASKQSSRAGNNMQYIHSLNRHADCMDSFRFACTKIWEIGQ